MANIINITEKNNRLEFSDTYTPIVCGNSNYVLKFAFSEQWQKCVKKAAFFVIDGNKLTVDFEGDECKVPVLPNAAFVLVSLVSGEKEEQLATTPIRIRLEPTMAGGDFSEFNQLTNYLPKVLAAINDVENGDIVVAEAAHSTNADKAAVADFADEAKNADFATLANASQTNSNPNLVINADFKINQRGKTVYTTGEKYTVDRWKLVGTNCQLDVLESGIRVSLPQWRRLRQTFDLAEYGFLKGQTVTCSCKILNYSTTGESMFFEINDGVSEEPQEVIDGSGIFTFTKTISSEASKIWLEFYQRNTGTSTVEIEWVKMEFGTVATTFIPKTTSEELANCLRYFRCIRSNVGGNMIAYGLSNGNSGYFPVQFDIPMRTSPTLVYDASLMDVYSGEAGSSIEITKIDISNYSYSSLNEFTLRVSFAGTAKQGFILRLKTDGFIEFDAEIY